MTVPAPLPTPTPPISPDNAPFWAATLRDELLLPRCRACGRYIWYPKQFCSECLSTDVEWVVASGHGVVYSYTVMRSGRSSGAYAQSLPYVLAFVTLDEGPTIMTNLVEIPTGQIEIGMPVRVVFHPTGPDAALPRFGPVSS